MIIFANEDGSIAAVSPSRITQGSVDANKIVLVGPFSNSVVTIAFTLPNGIVLRPNIAGLPEEYTPDEDENYTMTELNDGQAVHTNSGLYAYSYTMNKALTSMSGTLGIQFFISTNRGTAENPTYTDTLATDKVNVPVYNGSRYIPDLSVLSPSEELIQLLSAIESALANTIKSDSGGNAQTIQSDVTVEGELDVGGDLAVSGNLGVKGDLDVINNDGVATITLDGATGTVTASTVGATDVNATSADIGSANIPTLLVTLIKALGGSGLIQFTDDGNGNASMWIGPASDVNDLPVDLNALIKVSNILVAAFATIQGKLTAQQDLEVMGNASVIQDLAVGGKLSALGDLDVGGTLTIKGNTISEEQETLVVKDNFIVTNSSGAEFSTSGLAIRLKGTSDAAYGIYYDPYDNVVKISEGTLSGDIDNVEFTPTANKAVPIAARDGFGNESGGLIPMWNVTQNAFVPSGVKVDANGNLNVIKDNELLPLATETYVNTYVDEQLDGIATILNHINNGGSTE